MLGLLFAAALTAAGGDGATAAAAREDRAWNLSVGTGAGGYVEFVDAFAGSGPVDHDASRRRDRLQLNLRADRELGRWLKVGLAYVYDRWTDAYFTGGAPVGDVDNRVHVLMLDATVRWVRTEGFELYSALAAGAGRWAQEGTGTAASRPDASAGPAFQLRYVGVAFGGEHLRLFADLGIGFEGLVVGGLVLRL